MKNKKSNLIIWIMSALVLGVLIGVIISSISTTGQAKAIALKTDKTSANINYDKIHQEFLAKYGDLLNQEIPEIQAEMPVEQIPTIPEPVLNATQVDLSFPKNRDCVELDQEFFDQFNTDINFIAQNGCVELIEDVTFDHSIVLNGAIEFRGGNHTITGFAGGSIELYDGAIIKDITLPYKYAYLHDDSQMIDCIVNNNAILATHNSKIKSCFSDNAGFYLSDNAIIEDSNIINITYSGIFVTDNAVAKNCNVNCLNKYESSKIGFVANGGGIIENSSSENCFVGFYASSSAGKPNYKMVDSIATNNSCGFHITTGNSAAYPDPIVNNLSAISNNVGFRITASYHFPITNNIASGNYVGYHMAFHGAVTDSIAENNHIGFYTEIAETVQNNLSTDNTIGLVGIYTAKVKNFTLTNNTIGANIKNIGTLSDTKVSNNEVGIILEDHSSSVNNAVLENTDEGIHVLGNNSVNAPTIDSGRYCNNAQNMFIYLNGLVQGTIYTTPTTIPGMYTNNGAIIKDCSEYDPNTQNEMID